MLRPDTNFTQVHEFDEDQGKKKKKAVVAPLSSFLNRDAYYTKEFTFQVEKRLRLPGGNVIKNVLLLKPVLQDLWLWILYGLSCQNISKWLSVKGKHET